MGKKAYWCVTILIAGFALIFTATAALADDDLEKNCEELIRRATNYQLDIKTVDIALGSAVDAGNMELIQSYKLKKLALKKQLESVMRAIRGLECVSTR
jgi:predicted dinucleotide-utilizing enzyme